MEFLLAGSFTAVSNLYSAGNVRRIPHGGVGRCYSRGVVTLQAQGVWTPCCVTSW